MNSKGQFYVITAKRSTNDSKSQFEADAIIDFASCLISSEKGQSLYSNYFKPVGFFQNKGGKWISFIQLKNFFFNSTSLANILVKSSFKYEPKEKAISDGSCSSFSVVFKKKCELFEYSKLPFFVVFTSSRLTNIFFLKLLVFISQKKKKTKMPTFNQLAKKPRIRKKQYCSTSNLKGCPQKKGVCTKIFITKPKKPNSAQRKVAKVRILSTGKRIIAYIPGQGHNLSEHSVVLIRGGKVPDLPGLHYQLIRGIYDFNAKERFDRSNRRSKYSTKKPYFVEDFDKNDEEIF